MSVEITVTTALDYLIPDLRVHVWDINEPYTYSDDFLKFCLLTGIKILMPRWNHRYAPSYDATIAPSGYWDVVRSTVDVFVQTDPPRVMYGDERPIVLAAAIAMKTGIIYTVGSNAVSWRDDEVSFSNMTGAQMQEKSLIRDMEELTKLLPERGRRLARSTKQSLLGYRTIPNRFEGE